MYQFLEEGEAALKISLRMVFLICDLEAGTLLNEPVRFRLLNGPVGFGVPWP